MAGGASLARGGRRRETEAGREEGRRRQVSDCGERGPTGGGQRTAYWGWAPFFSFMIFKAKN